MLKYLFCLFVLGFFCTCIQAQSINPEKITIARDTFGVPHIFADTDAEAAYGLAWAHCEDDFRHVQENLLAAKGMLGRIIGKEGALFDFAVQFLGIDTLVEDRYDPDLSADFKKVLEAYSAGVNAFALSHPDEILYKKAFPIHPKDIIRGYVLSTSLMSGTGLALKAIRENRIHEFMEPNETGSNAVAIAPSKTEDGKTWLMVNSHQPIEGRFAWYEAHISSGEGWNIIGGLFPGGVSIFVGTSPQLGWAHTTNYHTFGDIYKLEINPFNNKVYKYGDTWLNFSTRTLRLKVKLLGSLFGIERKALYSVHGPVFKSKHGYYAIRFPAYTDIRSAEQWYRMNKAKNLGEFREAIQMEALPLFNIMYADAEGNIMLHSGGMYPDRDSSLKWHAPLDGKDPRYVWKKLIPFDRQPSYVNPSCGYLYNANNTPEHATDTICNKQWNFPGMQHFEYNRGNRFAEMMNTHKGKFTWEEFLKIKFDTKYTDNGTYFKNFKILYQLDPMKYKDLSDVILKMKNWNRTGDSNNTDAAFALLTHKYLTDKHKAPMGFLMISENPVFEPEAVEAMRFTRKYMIKKYGSVNVPLSRVQRHIRGAVSLPVNGLKEVPRAVDVSLHDKKTGVYRMNGGDGYIQMAKFSSGSVELETVNAYGASARPESPHYTDQMQLFVNQKFKKMTFDKEEILKKAKRIYHPK